MNPQSIRSRIQEIVTCRVRTFRMAKGLTQESLAKQAGLNCTHISKIESGKRLPSLKAICRLANVLDIEAYELLVAEETAKTSNYKKQQLIKIFNESGAKEIDIYFILINALHKKKS